MWFPMVVKYKGKLRVIWGKMSRRFVWYKVGRNDNYFKLRVPDGCSFICKLKLWFIGLSEFWWWVEND